MLFNSISFLFFFPIVTTLYFISAHRYRWFLLLCASCGFYMAFIPKYILILAFTIVIDYIAGIAIERAQGPRRKLFLILSLVSNCGALAVFKYYNFFIENVSLLFRSIHLDLTLPYANIILPIGLSFHTFQAMSYTIEVYRGKFKAERHFGIFALYVMFYPQLVAGPIERPHNLLHQFYEKHNFDNERVTNGLRLMLWGMFKKVVIADNLSILVDQVYKYPQAYDGVSLCAATLFFSCQIFCDFSGYSDIAIGAAEVMGFKLMTNFDRPYHSKSISEFWRRWHISLSTWFRDYLYIPLGGNRAAVPRWYLNLMTVFLVSGLWHGAKWTFIVWGALHGLYLIGELSLNPVKEKLYSIMGIREDSFAGRFIAMIVTFVLVSFAWIFFRANNLHDAVYIVAHLATGWGSVISSVESESSIFAFRRFELGVAVAATIFMEIVHCRQKNRGIGEFISSNPVRVRWAAYYVLTVWILLAGNFGSKYFIYFQF